MHILVDSSPKMKNKHEVDCVFASFETHTIEPERDFVLNGNITVDLKSSHNASVCSLKTGQNRICDLCNEHTCSYLKIVQ